MGSGITEELHSLLDFEIVLRAHHRIDQLDQALSDHPHRDECVRDIWPRVFGLLSKALGLAELGMWNPNYTLMHAVPYVSPIGSGGNRNYEWSFLVDLLWTCFLTLDGTEPAEAEALFYLLCCEDSHLMGRLALKAATESQSLSAAAKRRVLP